MTQWKSIETVPSECSEAILLLYDGSEVRAFRSGPSDGSIYARTNSVYNWFDMNELRSIHDADIISWKYEENDA